MAISESERRELHAAVEKGIGARAADLFLAMTEPELPFVLRSEMAGLRVEMADLRTELRSEMAGLRVEMAELRTELRGELAGLVPKLWAANLASMVGVAGLVVAAAAVL